VGGDDAAQLFFSENGQLFSVHRVDRDEPSCDAWYGLDLSACEPIGDPITVACQQ